MAEPRKVDSLRLWAVEQACAINNIHWADVVTLAEEILEFVEDDGSDIVNIEDIIAEGSA